MKKKIKRKATSEQIELYIQKCIGEYFHQHGMSSDLGEWIFKGIGDDVRENWSDEKFFEWVAYGQKKYGFTIEHHRLVNELTRKLVNQIPEGF